MKELAVLAAMLACGIVAVAAQALSPDTSAATKIGGRGLSSSSVPGHQISTPELEPPLRITSPLGRTGLAGRVRIVAQIRVPSNATLSAVNFYVDGAIVGTVQNGPPYAVEWDDVNPFERREIVVETADSAGHILRDSVVLPPFEITDRTDVSSVLLEAGVYDKLGRFINDLPPTAFVVTENGAPEKIDLITRETLPTTLLLLVDNSQSMSRRMDVVQRATDRLAAGLKPRDRVIVAPFNAHLGVVTGPTDDGPTISQAIAAMRAGGGTAILDSLLDTLRLLEHVDGRRAIIVVTDGYDEDSKSAEAAVISAARKSQATIYGVGIGGVAGISLKGEDMLRHLADATGGRAFFPPREPDLAAASDAVSVDAHSRYLITYTPANQKKDGTWREINVAVPTGYRVRTRPGYFAESPPPIRPTLEFTVETANRDAYADISAEDIDVTEDGTPQKIASFQEAVDPVSIVIALDSSGSMKKAAEVVKATALEFVLSVRPEDKLGLITFADQPLFAHTLSTNRQWSIDAIDKYVAVGGTALYDALWNSLMHLRDAPGRKAVVVLTDGRDENNPGTAPGSGHTLDEVLKLNEKVQAATFAIGLGTKVDAAILTRLADDSGGAAYFPAEADQLHAQFANIVENLRRRYILSYVSTNSNHDGSWRSVTIAPKSKDLVVVSRGGYFAPPQ